MPLFNDQELAKTELRIRVSRSSRKAMEVRRIGVIDEQEVFRLGVVASLSEDPFVQVVFSVPTDAPAEELDAAVVSAAAACREHLPCPLILLTDNAPSPSHGASNSNLIFAELRRSSLTGEQLIATVRAVSAGLRVQGQLLKPSARRRLDDRRQEVLRMLSEGAGTQTIAQLLNYSERTIKTFISQIEQELNVQTRAHAVAEGIRQGLI
jgi:DNA-binding CsgD family transcriptional regulator